MTALNLAVVTFAVVVVVVLATLLVVALSGSRGASAWIVLAIWVLFSGLIVAVALRSG